MVLFWGIPYADFVIAIVIVAASIITAKIFIAIFSRAVLHVTSKTKTTMDDLMLEAVRKPAYAAIILAGVFLAVDYVNYIDAYIPHIRAAFTVIWIALGAYAASRIINAFFRWYASEMASKTKTKTDETLMPIIRKIINAFVFVIAFVIILKSFGVEITPLVAGLGIGGLAIALALQESLANLFSGTFIISDKVIKAGDYIEIEGGLKGYVEEIGWRSTRIRTLPNNMVIIPNSKLANSIVTDYSSPVEEMSLAVPVGVSYSSDLEKVEKVTVEVAMEVLQKAEGGKKDFEPFVRFNEFGDSNINFSVILKVEKFVDKYRVTHEFIKALKKRYDQEGIEISFPVRKLV